jgi:thymidine kinase
MFIYGPGKLVLIEGSMFSGKSSWLIELVLKHGPQCSLVYKAGIDDRYMGSGAICSHDMRHMPAIPVGDNLDLIVGGAERWISDWSCPPGILLVVVDEVQFMGSEIVGVAQKLMSLGVCTVFAGLNLDFLGRPFGQMPALASIAHTVVGLKANCSVCGAPATMTQRIVNGVPASRRAPLLVVGGFDSYQPRCANCHVIPD